MFQIKAATAAEIPVIQELVEQIWRPTYQAILEKEQIEYMVELMYSTATLTKQFAQGQAGSLAPITPTNNKFGSLVASAPGAG